jgi:hypothetical protein
MAAEPLPLLPHEEPLPPRTDLWAAASFFAFSIAILALAWHMPTYANQGGPIYNAPGLVPSFYGIVIGLLSLWLGVRSLRAGALAPARRDGAQVNNGNSNARLALAAGLGHHFIQSAVRPDAAGSRRRSSSAAFIAHSVAPGLDAGPRLRARDALAQGLAPVFWSARLRAPVLVPFP